MTSSVEGAEAVEGSGPLVLWQIPADEVVDLRDWGDELVVRTAGRAQTHLLSAAAGTVLLALLDGRPSLTIDALFARAFADSHARSSSDAMSADERDSLLAIVAELERLGIVTRSTA